MSIFPSVPILEDDEIIENEKSNDKIGRSFLFDFEKGQFLIENGQVKETTELQALIQWIELCLKTEIDKFQIYKNKKFGCRFEDLIGNKLDPFIESEFKREVEEALLQNKKIKIIENISISQEKFKLFIKVTMKLYDESILDKEVSVNV